MVVACCGLPSIENQQDNTPTTLVAQLQSQEVIDKPSKQIKKRPSQKQRTKKSSKSKYTPEELQKIEKSKQVAKILKEVEADFYRKKKLRGSENEYQSQDLSSYVSKMRKSFYELKHRWSKYKYGYGENKKVLGLPKYIEELEPLISGDSKNGEPKDVVTISADSMDERYMPIVEAWFKYDFDDDCDENDKGYDEHDDDYYADEDCDKNQIKKFIKKICKELDEKQKEILVTLVHILHSINEGSIEAIHALVKCLAEIEEDLFDILKAILILIDKLIQIGIEAVKLVLEAIIEAIGAIIRGWEEKKCGCECPNFLHSLLRWLINIITWTPQKKLHQLIEHIIDIFTSFPLPRCTCACEGIFALGIDENEDFSSYNVSESPLILFKREETENSDFSSTTAVEDGNSSNDNSGDEIIVDAQALFPKIKSSRKSGRGVRQGQVNNPFLNKIDSILEKKIQEKHLKEKDDQSAKPTKNTNSGQLDEEEYGSYDTYRNSASRFDDENYDFEDDYDIEQENFEPNPRGSTKKDNNRKTRLSGSEKVTNGGRRNERKTRVIDDGADEDGYYGGRNAGRQSNKQSNRQESNRKSSTPKQQQPQQQQQQQLHKKRPQQSQQQQPASGRAKTGGRRF